MKHSFKDQLFYELKSAAFGYPKFIYFNADQEQIPVFVYHTIEPEIFESHLLYLKSNGYRTLSIDEFITEFKSNSSIMERTVLITIDDARSSVWRFAFPLLCKYQMNATLFIIPGLTPTAALPGINLNDVWKGGVPLESVFNVDPLDQNLCTWNEVEVMYNSGFMDIEIHTLFHREVFSSSKLVDFITPETNFLPYNYSGSPYFPFFSANIYDRNNYIGLPIFETSPLMLAGPALRISPEFITKCKSIYISCNEATYAWKDEINDLLKLRSSNYFFMESDSTIDVIEDLSKSQAIIQNKLNKNAGNHLCLPWTVGNLKTIQIVKDLGLRSCFWGSIPAIDDNRILRNEFFISRIKNDFIYRLPGNQRKSLISIYNEKFKRRLSGKKIF